MRMQFSLDSLPRPDNPGGRAGQERPGLDYAVVWVSQLVKIWNIILIAIFSRLTSQYLSINNKLLGNLSAISCISANQIRINVYCDILMIYEDDIMENIPKKYMILYKYLHQVWRLVFPTSANTWIGSEHDGAKIRTSKSYNLFHNCLRAYNTNPWTTLKKLEYQACHVRDWSPCFDKLVV